jgi:hypothetical protein
VADPGGLAVEAKIARISRNANHLLGKGLADPREFAAGSSTKMGIEECEAMAQERPCRLWGAGSRQDRHRHYTDIKECETFAQRGGLPGPSRPTAGTDRKLHGHQGMRNICSEGRPARPQRTHSGDRQALHGHQGMRNICSEGRPARPQGAHSGDRQALHGHHGMRNICSEGRPGPRGTDRHYTDIKECETFAQRGGLPGPSEPTARTDRHYTDIKECETFAQRGGLPGPSEPTARTDRHYTDIKECETFVWERLGGLQVAHGGAGAGTTRTSRN